ncbi:LuxR C-terminal-related transcriptional regulator [Rhodococcus sp. IEGM 1330]|uniref:LuxR C-terminal-related transcriptional regulator n=1 Tax=Rhodococcus sp. IEGM 1330 TaxID=3082225 RepID=UPI002953C172|nr:LuxR C-terminal-related transcriptional regulator [Rhodococcus sp. IEGM 1330]MDV8023808.1 LuxR C-terminal-related transcriptional regulator [Rhodococcus sp. IEGM 1330]
MFRILPTGSTNADISSELYLSETTVKTHISGILIELGCAQSSGGGIGCVPGRNSHVMQNACVRG